MLHALRRNTTTTQVIWVCDDTAVAGTSVIGIGIDGGAEDVAGRASVTSATDWTGLVTVSGLSADTTHTYQVYLAGSAVSGATGWFRTAPAVSGDMRLLFVGDVSQLSLGWDQLVGQNVSGNYPTAHAVYTQEPDYIDETQWDTAVTTAGLNTLNTTRALTTGGTPALPSESSSAYLTSASGQYTDRFDKFLATYRLKLRLNIKGENNSTRWRKEFARRFSTRNIWGNHALYTITVSPWTPAGGMAQFEAAAQAQYEYAWKGNPEGSVPDPDSFPNPVFYFGETIGDARVVCTDIVPYNDSSAVAFLDGTAQVELVGAGRGEGKQLAWLKDEIDNCTSKYLIIYTSTAIDTGGDPAKGQSEWTESGGIFASLNAKDVAAVIFSANVHTPFVRYISGAAANLGTRGILEVGVSPLNHPTPSGIGDLAVGTVNERYVDERATTLNDCYARSGAVTAFSNSWAYGRAVITAAGMQVSLIEATTGEVLWTGLIAEGGRDPA